MVQVYGRFIVLSDTLILALDFGGLNPKEIMRISRYQTIYDSIYGIKFSNVPPCHERPRMLLVHILPVQSYCAVSDGFTLVDGAEDYSLCYSLESLAFPRVESCTKSACVLDILMFVATRWIADRITWLSSECLSNTCYKAAVGYPYCCLVYMRFTHTTNILA